MKRTSTLIALLHFFYLAASLPAAGQDGFHTERMNKFYAKHSPPDILRTLKADFKEKKELNVFALGPSPTNWVKEEHIPELLKWIYSTDSTRSVVSFASSYLSTEKFSSLGREAQNLIECFRSKKSYPLVLNSYGPPDKKKAKELESWWKNYSLMQGVWWRQNDDPSALFMIQRDSLYYTEELSMPYFVKIKEGTFSMMRENHESVYLLKTLTKDSLVFFDKNLGRKVSFFKKR